MVHMRQDAPVRTEGCSTPSLPARRCMGEESGHAWRASWQQRNLAFPAISPGASDPLTCLPGDAKKVHQVMPGTDVAFLMRIDGANREPVELESSLDAADNHLDFELESRFMAVERGCHQAVADEAVAGLIVGDRLTHSPRECQLTEGVACAPDERHLAERARADDQICSAGRVCTKKGWYLAGIVLPISVKSHYCFEPLGKSAAKARLQCSALALVGHLANDCRAGLLCAPAGVIR